MPETKRNEFPETVDHAPPKVKRTDQVPKVAVPPDGGWGWMILLGTMTVNFVIIGHGKSFGVYFRKLMEEFDASPSRVAWLQSLQISMFCFLSIFTKIEFPLLLGKSAGENEERINYLFPLTSERRDSSSSLRIFTAKLEEES
ncbi:uncharacterized protein CEXT_122411 [Caerostris extrusa]|uniref:Uncharacterized protein n=1 Tax=Caerostris extrusa TaxID=172846 RepID=A0AAV4WDH0_CAEEX|nr:uncharacterized protein CEXT_122411 [Caerostris extrusa]